MLKPLALIVIAIAVQGCTTYAADRYTVSIDSQVELERLSSQATNQKIAVDNFTATIPGRTSLDCRALSPIKTPDNETFEAFIQKALTDQLRLAKIYAPDSSVRIGANLDDVRFSSNTGTWVLALTVRDDEGRSFSVRETYDYVSSLMGDVACDQTAQAFMPAVQDLIRKVVSAPTFREMVGAGT